MKFSCRGPGCDATIHADASLFVCQTDIRRVDGRKCVPCHADATPAGPSNRSSLAPTPPLINDGASLNPLRDEFLQNVITLGGAAMGKSAMMPPWGRTLSAEEIRAVMAHIRVVAQPPYQAPGGKNQGTDGT